MVVDNCIVRPFQERDRERIREICRRTGFKGNPIQLLFEDEGVGPLLFTDYYMEYEPEACFVAEVDGQVVGYIVGCEDTRRYNRVLWRKIVPRLVLRLIWKIATFQYRKKTTYQTLWWAVTRGWREIPHPPIDQYPAHAHFNVEVSYRRQMIGYRLTIALWRHLLERGVKGFHGVILEAEGEDKSATMRARWGARLGAAKRFSLLESATRRKWVTRVILKDL